jgi:ABC-2 type transport system permease protein
MSRTLRVARADFRRLLRRRRVWAATLLLALAFLPSLPAVATPEVRPIAETLLVIPLDMLSFVLVVVAAVGYGALGRTAGTVRTAVTLAGTRRTVLVGRLYSRLVAGGLVVAAVLAIGNVVVGLNYGRPYLLGYWTMAAWLLGYTGMWTTVAMGYAAGFGSSLRAVVALAGTYAVFSPAIGLWNLIIRPGIALVVTGSSAVPNYEVLARAPLWLRVTERLNPVRNLYYVLRWCVRTVGPGTPVAGLLPTIAGVAVLLLFAGLPFVWGLRRFERADLNTTPAEQSLRARLRDRLAGVVCGFHRLVVVAVPGSVIRPTGSTTPGRIRLLARAELRHATRQWLPVAGIIVAVALTAPSLAQTGTSTVFDTATQLIRIPGTFWFGVVTLGLAVGGRALSGGRAAGTVHQRLTTGARRWEVVVATVCARGLIVGGVLATLWLCAEILVILRLGSVYPGAFFAGLVSTLFSAGVWLAIVLGASAATSTYRALGVAFGVFLLFGVDFGLWYAVVQPLLGYLATGTFEPIVIGSYDAPAWVMLVDRLNPFVAVDSIETGLYALAGHDRGLVPPWWLVAFATVVAVGWLIGPLILGLRRFNRSDLG